MVKKGYKIAIIVVVVVIGLVLLSPILLLGFVFLDIYFHPDEWNEATKNKSFVPNSVPYHTAEDLYEITGVKFPEVTLVDSLGVYGFRLTGSEMKFVPRKRLTARFLRSLEKDDWYKDSLTYIKYFHLGSTIIDGEEIATGPKIDVTVSTMGDNDTITVFYYNGP